MTLFAGQIAFAQKQKPETQNGGGFYFYYRLAGLGSNFFLLQPALRIYDHNFTFTKEQYWVKRNKKAKVEFISKGYLQQSSIDSILLLMQSLKDTTIYKTNPCIMSGGITYITIALGADTTKFTLYNTSDLTALKIINIINPYLPDGKKLYGSEKDIKEEEDCRTYLKDEIKKQNKDGTNTRP